jgi:CheY-like chemotaxis protein
MEKALLLDPKKNYGQVVKSTLRAAKISVATANSVLTFTNRLEQKRPDLILCDVTMPGINGLELLKEVRTHCPDVPILILTHFGQSMEKPFSQLSAFEPIDFIRLPLKRSELTHRALRLLKAMRTHIADTLSSTTKTPLLQHLVPDIHNPETGRIDAKKVSELLGVPLAHVAQMLGRSLSAVHKTSDSVALQPGLAKLEQIIAALLRLAGSPQGLRIWLNSPNRELEDLTPIELLKDGKVEVVADLLEDALLGQPG